MKNNKAQIEESDKKISNYEKEIDQLKKQPIVTNKKIGRMAYKKIKQSPQLRVHGSKNKRKRELADSLFF